jgi:hypothetical protein
MPTTRTLASTWAGPMPEDESVACGICKIGRVTRRMEQIAFRQISNKGYLRCCVTVLIGTCDNCQTKSTGPEAKKVFDEAFKREYDRLP